MDVQIEGQHTEVTPETQAWITERLEGWNHPDADITHARVTLLKHTRHHKGSDEARIVVNLSGKTLSATQIADTLDDALYGVLKVMERELREFRRLRRGVVKGTEPRSRGRIVRLFPERDYGFIETDARREVYFHAHAVHGTAFAQLAVGMGVALVIEAGHAGPQAAWVMPQAV